MKLNFLFILTFLLTLGACSPSKKAQKKFETGQYDVAINYYQQALEKGKEPATHNFYIAESFRLSNRLDKALDYYKAALEEGIEEEEAEIYYGLALKVNGEYKKAEEQLRRYVKEGTNFDYLNIARNELKNLEVLNRLEEKKSWYEVANAEPINTEAGEYSPVVNNGLLYFTSSRGDGKVYKTTGTNFTDIYTAKLKDKKVLPSTTESMTMRINDPGVNEGSVTFARKGRMMVFAKGNSGKRKGANEVNLFITYFKDDQWTEPKMLNINDPNAWDSSPAFSGDGRTLYFASNREGGFGGIDLYSARMDANGRWGRLKNMGQVINTPGDEMFPYVSDEGKLYFSSSGHPGFGGLDLFIAEKKDGKIEVENMGQPINSSKDDFGITFFDQSNGFFSSNRDGGKGDDDIYRFKNNSPDLKIVNYYLVGTTTTTNEKGNREILPNVKIRFEYANGDLITRTISDGEGKFKFKVEGGRDYTIIGEKKDHFTSRKDFSTVGKTIPKEELTKMETNVTFETTVNLDEIVVDKAIVLDNIYYDFDKADIREDAAKELDKLVRLLKDNKNIKIELSSHTDSRGDNEYNRELSQRRAESAVEYIINSGISSLRITAKGYGETQPIVEEAETEEEHEMNRRTEFKVVELIEEEQKSSLDDAVPINIDKEEKE